MQLKITLNDRFAWIKNCTPGVRRKLIEYALDKLSPEEIQQILSLPATHPSGVKPEEKTEGGTGKINARDFEI